ncbi:MAG: alkyl hydroperoxide reductase, partial [Chloroflexi bacterium]|nr:alkyl hydroperoxide reductase [Chloroflexota bacterium]
MHIFPQLRKLEEKYRGELAVVGIHSAKFIAEKETFNLRNAVLRYEIEHPVVNDKDFQVWQSYACRAWPTLMFIDPEGKVIGKHEGEIAFETADRLVAEMVSEFDEQGLLDHTPLKFRLEREKEWERALSFPGKVHADARSGRLFIADSNHNRIVVTTLEGKILEFIGSGERGLKEGSFDEATFYDPQGMDVDGEILYVADTKNHAIRRVDLEARTVQTLAGTGEQATYFHQGGKGPMA